MLTWQPKLTLRLVYKIVVLSFIPSFMLIHSATSTWADFEQEPKDSIYSTSYIGAEDLKTTDKVIQTLTSPLVVYTVLLSFAILVVITTYFVSVGLIFVFFFKSF